MPEEYVSKEEFNILKGEVQEIKEEISIDKTLLLQIDKKIDVISEKIMNREKIDELKLQPIISRLTKLEENQSWLSKTVLGTIISVVVKIIFDISKNVQ